MDVASRTISNGDVLGYALGCTAVSICVKVAHLSHAKLLAVVWGVSSRQIPPWFCVVPVQDVAVYNPHNPSSIQVVAPPSVDGHHYSVASYVKPFALYPGILLICTRPANNLWTPPKIYKQLFATEEDWNGGI
uniref:Uncharacterized protein n=1 Tax=Knipowitschia caucasica TaxID=637954 RepID=A0AAV2ISB2_KNICA